MPIPSYLSYRGTTALYETREPNPDFLGKPGNRWRKLVGEPDIQQSDEINLSVAENTLMFKELTDQIKKQFPVLLKDSDFTYGEGPGGTTRLRTLLSNFLNTHFNITKSQITPGQVITTPGVYAALEQISWAVANPGDGILVGQPLYGGFIKGFAFSRSKVKVVSVEFGDVDPYGEKAVETYKNAMDVSNDDGTKVKALLLCNPHNPTGRCYTKDALNAYIDFCVEKKIHLITDEIYGMSHYKTTEEPFISLLSLDKAVDNPDYCHTLYGMSKDFGASGVRLGAIISRGDAILVSIITNSFLSWVSSGGDLMWSSLLSEEPFLQCFFEKNRANLAKCYTTVTTLLDSNYIKYENKGGYGLYVWIDLSYALEKPTPPNKTDAEREQYITDKLTKAKIKLSPGRKYKTEHLGWYRLTFSRPETDLTQAVERIVSALGPGPRLDHRVGE